MCHEKTCKICQKTTWGGCGQHKRDVMRRVPSAQRCRCTDADREAHRKSTFFGRIFG